MKTQDIQTFLLGTTSPLAKLYKPCMECQCNVSGEGGKPFTAKTDGGRSYKAHTDGKETWKPFRIPWNADGDPQYNDTDLSWNFGSHVEAIGLTGWDWMSRKSVYVGFDIDSITGHKSGLGDDDLANIETKCSSIPWINLYRSTGGKGLHLYLFFDEPVPTNNHSEHAALARSLLSVLTVKTGIDFYDKTDCVGSILWIWHRKIEGNRGLSPINKASKPFPISLIPKNWREHIPVTRKLRKRTESNDPAMEKIFAGIKETRLTSAHRKLLNYLDTEAKYTFWWDIDWNRLVTHTNDLKDAHIKLELKGLFDTNTSGSSDQNCFCFPADNGGWVVRRFGSNVSEHNSWVTDENGWTKCYYNMPPSFAQASLFFGGNESTGNWFVFTDMSMAQQVFNALEIKFSFSSLSMLSNEGQQIRLKKTEDAIHIKIPKDLDKSLYSSCKALEKFVSNKGHYLKIIHSNRDDLDINETTLPDAFVRSVIVGDESAGWFIKVGDKWVRHGESQVKTVIQTLFKNKKYQDVIHDIGQSLLNPWELVNKPFQLEYTGDREWNRDGAQFPFAPIQGSYPHWKKVIDHIGKNLDEGVKENKWCSENGIADGSDYIFNWIASMFQHPYRSLPFLSLVSEEQNTGKSTLHQGLRYFFKGDKGYISANNALNNKSGFNGELHGGILAVCEEIDLRQVGAYNRIKDWVTGKTLLITDKFKTSFEAVNTLHFIQSINNSLYCPIFPGDTRITMIRVSPLTYLSEDGDEIDEEIPEEKMHIALKNEAPFFLHDLLNHTLPDPPGRLGIPVIETDQRTEVRSMNRNPLQEFIEDNCYYTEGSFTRWIDFYNAFRAYIIDLGLSEKEQIKWSQRGTSTCFPINDRFPKGKYGAGHPTIIGNMTMFEDLDNKHTGRFVKADKGRLILLENNNLSRETYLNNNLNNNLNKENNEDE